MEFRFNIGKIFKSNISRIGNSLLPAGYVAPDRRSALDATAYVAEIINTIGQASAAAQGLNQAVTTSDRLRNTDDQIIYLMTEDNEKNGLVVGLLKIGRKSLYVFDKFGETRHVHAPCVLDFYIHESRQRAGLGKVLFEYMLEFENLLPEQMAVDRPSEKLLGFLKKHYALTQKIPQMNNFVIYDGFFSSQQSPKDVNGSGQMHITASPNSSLFGPQFVCDENQRRRSNSRARPEPPALQTHVLDNSQQADISNQRAEQNHETSSSTSDEYVNHDDTNEEAVEELAHEMQTLDVVDEPPASLSPGSPAEHVAEHVKFAERERTNSIVADYHSNSGHFYRNERHNYYDSEPIPPQDLYRAKRSSTLFNFNKRQTGKKNLSTFVVGDNNKIEFDQMDDKGFGVVKINRPIGMPGSRAQEHLNDDESIHSRDSEQTHTADGFFDLKFYSHPLW